MKRLQKAPRGLPVCRVEHSKTYLQDGPEQHRNRVDYESVLFVRHIYDQGLKGESFVQSALFFKGATRDEADQKMIDWIEKNGAVEADLDADTEL